MGGLLCAPDPPFPAGYCSQPCSSTPCGAGAVCDASTTPALCLRTCAARSDCRTDYMCWRGACRPDCLHGTSCGADGTCGADGQCVGPECTIDADCDDPTRECVGGRCVLRGVDAGRLLATGDPCGADAECETGVCLPASRGGVCTAPCRDGRECISVVTFDSACGPVARGGAIETLCVPYVTGGGELGAACSSDAQCATNTCEAGQCTEACDAVDDCLTGHVCDTITRAPGSYVGCTFTAGTGVRLEEIDLGTHTLRAGAGTGDVVFVTPPDSISVTFVMLPVSGDPLPMSFWQVHDPTGREIFDLETVSDLGDPPIRWYPQETVDGISMLVPNTTTDRLRYVPGRHRVAAGAFVRMMGDTGMRTFRLSALVKRASAAVSAQALDLDVFLVGVGLTAATAPGNMRVMQMLSRFTTVMGRVGVSMGAVSYFQITGADETRYQQIDSTDGPTSELSELFRLSSRGTAGARRLSVFLVRRIVSGREGFQTLGIAGGIPGMPGIPGTRSSGVVVTFDSGAISATAAGHVLAHETGHFLGLFHVTESSRPCGAGETPPGCAPWGGTDVIGDTTRGDTTNLMHWSIVGSGSNDRLTAGQGFVLLRSALTR